MAKRNKRSKFLQYQKLILSRLRINYHYLLFGLTALLIIYMVIINFFSKARYNSKSVKTDVKTVENQANNKKQDIYVVKEGDHLWKIAEEAYGSGYNAYDIAAFNKISDPNLIFIGQKLVLPKVTVKTPTRGDVITLASTQKVSLTGNKYTVKEGDCLWKIALEAYGDGYAWVKIAKANNLVDPNLILPKTVLTIPRN